MNTLTLDVLYSKLKTYEMNTLSKRTDTKSTALVSSSGFSLDTSPKDALVVFNAMSDDQLEEISEEDLGLVASRFSRAISNVRYRKRGGPSRCFHCGGLGHLRSHCPKLGRNPKEEPQDDIKNTNQNKKQFKNMKMKKFYQKAHDEAVAVVQESSDVEF